MSTRTLATMATAVVASVLLLVPASSGAQEEGPADATPGATDPPAEARQQPARLSLRVKGLKGGKRPALRRTTAVGRLHPFVPGQRVRVKLVRRGKVVKQRRARVRPAGEGQSGKFKMMSPRLKKPGRYRVRAIKLPSAEQEGAQAATPRFRLQFPRLRRGDRGPDVRLLNRLLRKRSYDAPKGKRFTEATADAVLAFRKVTNMPRSRGAAPEVLQRLLHGGGKVKVRHPGAGRHVEVNIARQVMILAKGRKAQHTFHISSGKSSTPSDRGHFRFHRRQPGYNNVRMLHSVYYNRGEAIHGYASVPTYPASHGCIRSPLRQARFIYNWVRLGMSIYVY